MIYLDEGGLSSSDVANCIRPGRFLGEWRGASGGGQGPSGVGWTSSIRKVINNKRGAMAGGDVLTEDKLESGDFSIHELSPVSGGGQDKRGGGGGHGSNIQCPGRLEQG